MASEVIERSMYAGRYKMVHNPNAKGRAPRYTITNTETGEIIKPKGVTTILGQTLAKDLVKWAVDSCVDYLRTKLPVITEADLKEGAIAYTKKRDSGANTGTEAHALVENYLKGIQNSGNPSLEAVNAYQAFVEWFDTVKPEVVNVEEVIYSEAFDYPGTYDCMLKIDGKVYLCDLKTTNASKKAPNGIYAENFLQLGAYAAAHEEQREYEERNGGTKLVKVDDLMVISAKKDGAMNVTSASDLGLSVSDCTDMFKRVMNIYQFMTYTTAQLGGK